MLACVAVCRRVGRDAREKAKESGCVNKPMWLAGDTYRCATQSGAFSYFNVPGKRMARPARSDAEGAHARGFSAGRSGNAEGPRRRAPESAADELATEEKLLAETRVAYADGAPAPLPEERADAEKYRARIGRLRQRLIVHERNIEALRKELAAIK